jgi:DNA-binding HxlR family transcriptional regulator
VTDFRYAQFCPLARVAEIFGERWTLLIMRDLFVGPQRFSDLRRRLPGISASVLSQRLHRLETNGLVRRGTLPPPGRADIIELTELGASFEDAMTELIRFGLRFVGPPEAADHIEPSWLGMGLAAVARQTSTPAHRFVVFIPDGDDEVVLWVQGGRRGVVVEALAAGARPASEATVRGDPFDIFAFASGALSVDAARSSEALELEGDLEALAKFHQLFDMSLVGSALQTPLDLLSACTNT